MRPPYLALTFDTLSMRFLLLQGPHPSSLAPRPRSMAPVSPGCTFSHQHLSFSAHTVPWLHFCLAQFFPCSRAFVGRFLQFLWTHLVHILPLRPPDCPWRSLSLAHAALAMHIHLNSLLSPRPSDISPVGAYPLAYAGGLVPSTAAVQRRSFCR